MGAGSGDMPRNRGLTDQAKHEIASQAVADAIGAMRAGDRGTASQILRHAAHEGASPALIVEQIVEQTGGSLHGSDHS